MRFLALLVLVVAWMAVAPAAAEEAQVPAHQALATEEADRLRFGITTHWNPKRLGRYLRLGLGWSLPQRWYDTDGQLLTERSLLNPGDDLERSGLYLAVRF